MPSPESLATFIEQLAGSMIEAQTVIDARTDAELAALDPEVRALPTPLQLAVMPTVHRLESMEGELSLQLESRRERDASVSLRLFGRPVTTFHNAHFERSERTATEVRIEVVAVPPFDRGRP